MLGGFFGGAGAAATAGQAGSIPPVVSLNGQVVSAGQQPMDLSAILGAEGAAHVRSSLEQLGLGGQLAGLFGSPSATAQPGQAPLYGPAGEQPLTYANTPGEVTSNGNKTLVWFLVVFAIAMVGILGYLAYVD
jgi:hypothetical protein